MKEVATYIGTRPGVKTVYFNAKGQWSLVKNVRYPIEKTREEVISAGGVEEDADDAAQVKSAQEILADLDKKVADKKAKKDAKA